MITAYQGEPGAFSEEAVVTLFPDASPKPCPAFDDVFEALVAGECDRAVVPIENSLFGSVHQNYDLLHEHDLRIVAEVQLRIRHQLLAAPGTGIDDIKRVRSHPQALGQCRKYLRSFLERAEVIPSHDTAGAARQVAESTEVGSAAIAGRRAAERYGLHILAEDIESNHHNFTRFLALARPDAPSDEGLAPVATDVNSWKTSILYAQKKNVPGGLFKSLAVFALRDIDLMRIESRPLVGSPGNYLFHLDIAGRSTDEDIGHALHHLEEIAAFVKVLGSYRTSNTPPA